MAYTRIPSQHIAYSLVEEERGKDAGRMQTVFLRVSFTHKIIRNCARIAYVLIGWPANMDMQGKGNFAYKPQEARMAGA